MQCSPVWKRDTILVIVDVEEIEFDGCTLIPTPTGRDGFTIEARVKTTPVEYQNSHIAELWLRTKFCGDWGE